jgi:hypothetical protein
LPGLARAPEGPAAAREIRREWRLVVTGDRAVAGGPYADQGGKTVSPGYPGVVLRCAQ